MPHPPIDLEQFRVPEIRLPTVAMSSLLYSQPFGMPLSLHTTDDTLGRLRGRGSEYGRSGGRCLGVPGGA